ncbi:MAG: TetR/AcrR family transcriptional regulator [Prevotellaceae bacterium]|jgi:AcrR family transcriptional regulator|nr:TetR/AcrR family transcriptional regulator [Prevotellaceae bacterium]
MTIDETEHPQRAELRTNIVDTALHLFITEGIKSITMDDIAAGLGISKRTLYEVFPDKETLLLECLYKTEDEAKAYAQKTYDESANVMETILKLYQHSIEQYRKVNKRFFTDINKYPRVDEELRRRHQCDSEEKIQFFRLGVEQGLFRSDINFDIVNLLVREQFNVLMHTDIFKNYPPIEVYKSVIFTYLRGIATEKGYRLLEEFIESHRE